jgi:integrase
MFISRLLSPTIEDLAQRYVAQLGEKHHASYRARTIAVHLGHVRISKLTPEHLRDFLKTRGHLSPQSIAHEVNCLKAIIRTARQEWGLNIPDHKQTFSRIAMPTIDGARERRLMPGEWQALWAEADPRMRLSMVLAVETGVRRGEMCAIQCEWIDLPARTVRLTKEVTKTKRGRLVPLSIDAVEVLRPYAGQVGSLLGMTSNAHRLSWHRTRDRAAKVMPSLREFHWHDFRHECLSRLAAAGWTPAMLRVVSGHADWRMLQRYVNLRPSDVLARLDEAHGRGL